MSDQDRLAALIDGVVSQHYPYITEGQMAPRWWHGVDHIYRKYHLPPDRPREMPYVALAVHLGPKDQWATEDEIKQLAHKQLRQLGPMPSKAEWERLNG